MWSLPFGMQNHGISKASAMDTRCLCINSLWPYDIICSSHCYHFGGQLHFQFPALEVTAPDNVIYKLRRIYTKTRPTLSLSIGLHFWRLNNIQVSLHVPYRVWSSWRKVEVRVVSDIRNPFGRVWHKGVWYKLETLYELRRVFFYGLGATCLIAKKCNHRQWFSLHW